MKKYLYENHGSIVVISLIGGMIIVTLLFSTITLFINDYYAVQSNEDTVRAYYLAESGIKKVICEMEEITEKTISTYLIDLKNYKINYIKNDNDINKYNPLKLEDYIQKSLTKKLHTLNKTIIKPFTNYSCSHSYSIKVTYDSSKKIIDIISVGKYNKARKFIHAKLKSPIVCNNGIDSYGLEKIKVVPLQLESYYQTFGK